MDYKAIQELIKTVSDSKLSLLEIESEGVRIKLEKKQEQVSVEKLPNIIENIVREEAAPRLQPEAVISSAPVMEQINEPAPSPKSQGILVTSPIVGTFYSSPGPNKDAFAQIGSRVKKGDVLCIIEAMKLMNEIEAEVDGEVIEILVKDEQMVEYGQPLFRIV